MKPLVIGYLGLFCALACGCGGGDVGQYAGKYAGTWGTQSTQYGSWVATVATDGKISGTGDSGGFTISGNVNGSGRMTFGGTYQQSLTATFTGQIDDDGNVSGTWTESSGQVSGTFTGGRVVDQ